MAPDTSQIKITGPEDFQAFFEVSDETIQRLEIYERTLRQWQKKINLVAPSTLRDVWQRHFADSAQLLRHAPADARRWVDLGSGAGFPGMVLAILRAGQIGEFCGERHVLIESDSRKAAFLGEISRKTSIPVDTDVARIELSSTQGRYTSVDVLTARALAPLDRLIDWTAPYFGTGTVALFLKGRDVEQEIELAERKWRFTYELANSLTEQDSRIVIVRRPEAKSEGT